MILLNEILNNINESVLDKGIFKAVFVVGIPGAGKSTIINKTNPSDIGAKTITIDKFYEHIVNKTKASYSTPTFNKSEPQLKKSVKGEIFNYINSVLPLIIDTTGSDSSVLLSRKKILNDIGYDTAMVYIDTNIQDVLDRLNKRPRKVDTKVIEEMYKLLEINKVKYKQVFLSENANYFLECENNEDGISKVDKFLRTFFSSELNNSIGRINKEKLKKTNGYLMNIGNEDENRDIKNKIQSWY